MICTYMHVSYLHDFHVWLTKTKLERDESSRTNHERTTRTSSKNHPETNYRQFPMVSVQKRWSKNLFFVHCHPGMPLAAHQSSQAMYRPLSTWHVELALFRRGTGWTKSHAAQAFQMAVLWGPHTPSHSQWITPGQWCIWGAQSCKLW